jgi:hypothetical protein
MNKNFPFEENMDEQFNALPIPDEEQSWQKMKLLLEEEDKRRRPLFFWFNGLVLGLLFLGLSAGAYFFFFNSNDHEDLSSSHKNESALQTPSSHTNSQNPDISNNSSTELSKNKSSLIQKEQNIVTAKAVTGQQNINSSKAAASTEKSIYNLSAPTGKKAKPRSMMTGKTQLRNEDQALNKDVTNSEAAEIVLPKNKQQNISNEANNSKAGEMGNINEGKKIEIADSIKKAMIADENPVVPKIDSAKKKTAAVKKLFFSAGLGIQQQVPIGGQESVPYDSYGRKVSLSDYIPSLFLRMHKENKWFLMGEFRYGAPQEINDFNYSQRSVYDSSSMTLATTTMRLKKTYYHQLPLSFNYYLKPGWSLGLGAMYSRFYAAVTEKEVRNYNVYTQDVSYTKSINNIRGFTDSFLHKSQVHLIVNTDYQYKNFLLGLRFTKDIQPFIKYTKPDGIINEEKNYTLQLIFRWQAWRSE